MEVMNINHPYYPLVFVGCHALGWIIALAWLNSRPLFPRRTRSWAEFNETFKDVDRALNDMLIANMVAESRWKTECQRVELEMMMWQAGLKPKPARPQTLEDMIGERPMLEEPGSEKGREGR